MIKDYLKTALRNVRNSKVYSLINITGLVVGLACFILLSLFVLDEMNYDSFNKNANQIYRIYVHSNFNGEEINNSKTPAPLGTTLENNFPEVINSTRIGYFGQYDIKYEDKSFREFRAYTADSTYFSIFTLPFIYGNPKTALKDPNSVVMTESTAEKYFGKENPLGKTLIVNDNNLFVITGVMKDFPAKSHFSCDFLISMSTYHVTEKNNWLDLWYTTYIVLKEGTDTNSFEEKLQSVVKNYVGPEAEKLLGYRFDDFLLNNNEYAYHIQPLKSIYLYSFNKYGIDLNTEWGNVKSSSITYSYLFMAIGMFILLIAIFNFMNLSTAKSEKRSNEVSIRKTLGSGKMMLILQFIAESVITCFFAVLFAIVLVQITLPVFNNFIGRDLKLEFFNNFYTIPAFFLFAVVVGIIAGSYPAFYLSSFQPAHIIKSKNGGYKNKSLRSLLVITQFAISITLIIGTLFIKRQLEYIQNKNLGFNKENLVTINDANVLGNKLEAFKNEILSNPDIKSATTSSLMFRSGIPGNSFLYNKTSGTDVVSSQFLDVDYDFPETYQIEMKEGRFFSRDFLTDSNAVVINEAAVKDFNAKDPIGKYIAQIDASSGNLNKYTIIGVIKDFNYESLHQRVRPLAFYLSPVRQASSVLTIRMSSEHIIQTIKYLEQTWNDYTTQANFNYTFMEQNLENMYRNENRVGTITTVFSSLAIFIACLGLLGLVAFITEQKTKEIGIRKVNGAKVSEILSMLNKDFVKWVVIAFVIATPVAWYAMNKWLENFAYKTSLSWWIFALAGLLALGIALLTVSWQSWRAATRNPVEALRYE